MKQNKQIVPYFTHFSNGIKQLILTLILMFSVSVFGRGERKDINNDFNDAQREELCSLVNLWLTTNLINMHGDHFGKMHTTNDFFRWHRDHFIDLENFILEKDPTGTLNYDDYVPFPKWNPANDVPSYFNGFEADGTTTFNNIASQCTGTGCRTREDYKNTGSTNFKFNQTGSFFSLIPMPAKFSSSLCSYSQTENWFNSTTRSFNFNDVTDFSDNHQYIYHNPGHVGFNNSTATPVPTANRSQMGTLGPNRAAGVFIFWCWHAWVDDMWWEWDKCHKQNNGTTITAAYDISTGLTLTPGTPITWNTSGNIKKIQGNIVIPAGCTLTIENGQIVEMLDDYYTDQACDIIVQAGSGATPGGRLYIKSGAIMRGVISMGINKSQVGGAGSDISVDASFTNIYPDAKMYYLSQWPGIKVYGAPSQNTFSANHGAVIIDGTTGGQVKLEYAKTAITSFDGGVVQCKNAEFKNCTIGVDFRPYLSSHDWGVNQSHFDNTTFTTEDQVSRYVTNDNVWMHYKHDFHHHYHVKLKGVRGISFGGCKFKNMDPNTFTGGHDNTRGTGIWTEDAGFYLHNDGSPSEDIPTGCPKYTGTNRSEFINLSFGINAENTVPASGPKAATEIGVQNAIFTNCHDAISSKNGGGIRVYRSEFSYVNGTFPFPSGSHNHFLDLDGNDIIIVYKNTFVANASLSTFIEISNNAAAPINLFTKIYLNKLTNNFTSPVTSNGVVLAGDNMNTDIRCNDFNIGLKKAILVTSGTLKTQGTAADGAGNKFAVLPFSLDPEQFLSSSTAFTYIHTQGLIQNPILCKSSNVTVLLGTNTSALTVNAGLEGTEESSQPCKLGCSGYGLELSKITASSNFKLYPNPSNNFLVVENLEFGNNQPYTIIIYDMIGKVVLVKNLNENVNGISLEGIIPGVYTASILKNNEVVNSIKLVKQ